MFNKLRLIIKNNDLKRENNALYEENKLNRRDIDDLELQRNTIAQLHRLEQIERSGNSEETKKKNRNVIYNDLRKQNINLIKELSNKFGNDR